MQTVTGIILSGGQGRRVGGADKGLLPWGESTSIGSLLQVFAPQVGEIIISANRNLDIYREMASKVVTDNFEGYQGPLAGIAAALAETETDCAVIVPCDCPNPHPRLAERLLSALEQQSLDLSYAHDGARAQYLFCALKRSCLTSLQDYMEQGGRSVKGWHLGINCGVADFSDCPEYFTNHNRRQPASKT